MTPVACRLVAERIAVVDVTSGTPGKGGLVVVAVAGPERASFEVVVAGREPDFPEYRSVETVEGGSPAAVIPRSVDDVGQGVAV